MSTIKLCCCLKDVAPLFCGAALFVPFHFELRFLHTNLFCYLRIKIMKAYKQNWQDVV
jgi:hypothetical protein